MAGEGWERARRGAFFALGLLYLILLLSPFSLLPYLVAGWFLEPAAGTTSHRVHDVTFGIMFGLTFTGVVANLTRRGVSHGAAYQMALPVLAIIVLGLPFGIAIDGPTLETLLPYLLFGLPLVGLLLLHPRGSRLLRPPLRPDRTMVLLALALAVPMAIYGVVQVANAIEARSLGQPFFAQLRALPADVAPETYDRAFRELTAGYGLGPEQQDMVSHAHHWSAMGASALTFALLAGIAAARPPGWRLVAWSTSLGLAYAGVVSIFSPDDASSFGIPGGILLVVWAGVFLGVALTREEERERVPA